MKDEPNRTRVDRDKHGIQIWNFGVGITQLRVTNWTSLYHTDSLFKESLILFDLNMVDYTVCIVMLVFSWDNPNP